MIIRPVLKNDLEHIEGLDTSYSTGYVWQMELKTAGGEVSTTFRPIRLPRAIKVELPREDDWLENWQNSDLFIVAEEDRKIAGYLKMQVDRTRNVGTVNHLAISKKSRRLGFGTALIQEVKRWSKVRRINALMAETQTRNYPAISFLQKAGFAFSGFNDSFHRNKDIAVYFVCNLV